MANPLLVVSDLTMRFYTEDGIVRAVEGSSLSVTTSDTLGIAGESGSGKTVTALSIMGLIENPGRIEGGQILFKGDNLLEKNAEQMRFIRGKEIAMVFQDSLSSLNPTMKIGDQIGRVLRYHTAFDRREIRERVVQLLCQVGIAEPRKRAANYPHELSGGMRQRALIAMAISCNPSLLILDEPTTALDVTIEAQIFELIERLKAEFRMGTILITHDLAVVASSCNRVFIMYAGRIVEEAAVHELFNQPLHPYTQGLLLSMPRVVEQPNERRLHSIPGEVPDLINLPEGCNFSLRCPYATEECRMVDPPIREVAPGRRVACHRFDELRFL